MKVYPIDLSSLLTELFISINDVLSSTSIRQQYDGFTDEVVIKASVISRLRQAANPFIVETDCE